MRSKIPVGFLFLVSLVFIGFGDQFLPSEIGRYSFQARSSIDQVLINLFPTLATEDESKSAHRGRSSRYERISVNGQFFGVECNEFCVYPTT